MAVPFEVRKVAGNQALEALADLQRGNEGYPVIVGGADSLESVSEMSKMDSDRTLEEILAQASEINPQEWFVEQEESEPEYYEIDEGDWPEADTPLDHLTAHQDAISGRPLGEVFIALVPTDTSWNVPAYLRIGGWNACPNTEEHVAIYKYWEEKYGARVACIADDVIEFQVARPPQTRAEAYELAKEHYIFCADIVQQGTESIEALASSLVKAPVWFFWWD